MKKPYHHGDLKTELVAQGIAQLEEHGLAALSLRKVAKRAGVSQAAPYSHFKDKRSLLAAVANEGYQRLNQRIAEETEQDPDSPTTGLGRGYVLFALENPALFHLMFSSEVSELIDAGDLDDSASECYRLLTDGIKKQHIHSSHNKDNKFEAAVAWSLVHGLANLLLEKRISPADFGFGELRLFIDNILTSYLE